MAMPRHRQQSVNMLGLTTHHASQVRLCFSLLSWRLCLDTIGISRQLSVTTALHPASAKEALINSTVAANCGVMRCSECSHMSEYAALPVLLFLALYSPQRITQNLPKTQISARVPYFFVHKDLTISTYIITLNFITDIGI